jgi:O-methyltransferase involved in polyketide biosynthesis
MPITLNAVEETLLIPLWHRAQASIQYPSLFCDPKAVDLVEAIDYDFSVIDTRFSPEYRLTGVVRARQCDMRYGPT